MTAKSSEWRPGPTVCRCCLSEGCYKDISTEYFWMGKREVYAEMLSDTLSVSIAYSTSGGPNSNSRLICEPCISRLRDASEFKRQVVECERMFMQHLDPGSSHIPVEVQHEPLEPSVKLERVKLEKNHSDDDFDDRHDDAFDDEDDDLDDQPLTKLASKVPKKESVDLLDLLDNTKAAEKRKSTTKSKAPPAKKLKKKEPPKPTTSKTKPEKKKKGDEPTAANKNSTRLQVNVESRVCQLKIVTQKELIRESVMILLQCTTFCPFRYFSTFLCMYCQETFLDMPLLVEHTNKVHGDIKESEIRQALYSRAKTEPVKVNVIDYGCKLCGIITETLYQLIDHLIDNHNKKIYRKNCGVILFKIKDTDDNECAICSKKFLKYRNLTFHVREHYMNFFCEQCGAGFITDHGLKGHMIVHETAEFPCTDCNKVFKSKTSQMEHYKIIHKKHKRNKCKVCSECFQDYFIKLRHMTEVHNMKVPEYKCNFCPKVFIMVSHWKAHEANVHLKSATYSCDVCNYKTHTKSSLKLHMICHSKEKNYQCEVCKKRYARKITWKLHMRIHLNDRRFACSYCDKAFVQKVSLQCHMKTHHKDVQI